MPQFSKKLIQFVWKFLSFIIINVSEIDGFCATLHILVLVFLSSLWLWSVAMLVTL